MQWSEQSLLKLIGAYRVRSVLWDPQHNDHFKKTLKANAWCEIEAEMDLPADECKRKIINLLSSYRREKSRIRNSKGKGKGSTYVSRWFAYESFKFLEKRNGTRKTSEMVVPTETKEETLMDITEIKQLHSPSPSEDLTEAVHVINSVVEETEPQRLKHKHKRQKIQQPSSSKINKTLGYLQIDPLASTTANVQDVSDSTATGDIYDHFGKYVASLLRGIGAPTAFRLQEKITSVIIEEICPPQTSSVQSTQAVSESESNMSDVPDGYVLPN